MRRQTVVQLIACLLLTLGGCGRNTGWLIKPVPIEERLTETVIGGDEGWFVADKVAVVDVDGLLMNQRQGGIFGEKDNPVSLFIEKLDKAQSDQAVRAVILRINSPGGGVTASDIMYRRLVRFKQHKNVPVIAVVEDVGAERRYYLACAADAIVAHPTSVTGSIGVMVQTVSFADAMQKLGIEARAITSGRHKDLASPLKPLDEKDLAILQEIVDSYYHRFLDVVASGRPNLDRAQLEALADGRVFSGDQAKANGLVDDLGYMDDAVALAKARSGSKRVRVVMYHRPLGYRANFYSASSIRPTQINLLNISAEGLLSFARPRFLYLWTGRTTGR